MPDDLFSSAVRDDFDRRLAAVEAALLDAQARLPGLARDVGVLRADLLKASGEAISSSLPGTPPPAVPPGGGGQPNLEEDDRCSP